MTTTPRIVVAMAHFVPADVMHRLKAQHPHLLHASLWGSHDPDDPDLPSSCIVGRDYDNPSVSVVVQGPNASQVSRRHVLLGIQGNEFTVTNLSGTNPTFKNGVPVSNSAPTPFNPCEDVISFGVFGLSFHKVSRTAWSAAVLHLADIQRMAASRHPHQSVGDLRAAAQQRVLEGIRRQLAGRPGGAADVLEGLGGTYGDNSGPLIQVIVTLGKDGALKGAQLGLPDEADQRADAAPGDVTRGLPDLLHSQGVVSPRHVGTDEADKPEDSGAPPASPEEKQAS